MTLPAILRWANRPAADPTPQPVAPLFAASQPTSQGKTWLEHFNEANELHRQGRFAEAALDYRSCFEAGHPYPAEALSSSLLCLLKDGQRLSEAQFAELQPFDPAYLAYITGAQHLLADGNAGLALQACGNAFEAFHTGTEPDRFFLHAAVQHFATPSIMPMPLKPYGDYGRLAVQPSPRTLMFYWDKNPPVEISANFEHHRALGGFDVQVYDKQKAEAFLYDYFGRETRTAFTRLRHPAEEADYFRAHVLYAYGGCYLDADLRLRTADALARAFQGGTQSTVFITSGCLVHNDLVVSASESRLMAECINVISGNCAHFPSLGIALKTGPGAFTRAINRLYFRTMAFRCPAPDILVLDQKAFDSTVECYEVSYKQDARNWHSVA